MNLIYGYLPCIVFLFGWCRLLISIPTSVVLLVLMMLFVKQMDNDDSVKVEVPILILTLVLSSVFCLIIGYGGVFANFYDYIKHSSIIQDLVFYDWPVIYTQHEPAMLTYYLGQYVIPSLFGKVLHNRVAAELFMGVIGWIGVYLLYLNLMLLTKADNNRKQLLLLVLFFFFSGMLLPLQFIYNMLPLSGFRSYLNPHWFIVNEWLLQYRSTLVALRWAYPQFIVPCMGAAMLYWSKNYKYSAFLILPSFLFGTWGFLCLVVLILLRFAIVTIKNKKFNFDIVSTQNIVVVLIGCIFLFYYWGNIVSDKPDYMKLSIITKPWYYIKVYLPFVLFMFGFYVFLVWQDFKTNSMFLSVVVILLLIPCFKMGYYNDFVMCVSLPALFLLSSYLFRFLFAADSKQKSVKLRKVILTICLLLACTSPLMESKFIFPLKKMPFPQRTLSTFTDRDGNLSDVSDICIDCMRYNYYTYYPENTFFYNYISRK